MTELRDHLVVERSQLRDGLWRYGRDGEQRSVWGLIESNDNGGFEIVQRQAVVYPWRDDGVTAVCLVSRSLNETRIEYDLSWRPVPEQPYRPNVIVSEAPVAHRETLGERAERLRHKQ